MVDDSPDQKPEDRGAKLVAQMSAFINEQNSLMAELRQQQSHSMVRFDSAEALARIIQKARHDQDLTLETLALLSGVSTVTLVKIEKSRANVSLDTLFKVTNALGLSLWIGR